MAEPGWSDGHSPERSRRPETKKSRAFGNGIGRAGHPLPGPSGARRRMLRPVRLAPCPRRPGWPVVTSADPNDPHPGRHCELEVAVTGTRPRVRVRAGASLRDVAQLPAQRRLPVAVTGEPE